MVELLSKAMFDPRSTHNSLIQIATDLDVPPGWQAPQITSHSPGYDVWVIAAHLRIPYVPGSEMFQQCVEHIDRIARKGSLEDFHRTIIHDDITSEGYIVLPQYVINEDNVVLFTQKEDKDVLAETLQILFKEFSSLNATAIEEKAPDWDLTELNFKSE